MIAAYPFHPALIDVMNGRWTSVDGFQRTRGALRFLACCLHALKKKGGAKPLLGPGDIPLSDADVARAMRWGAENSEARMAGLLKRVRHALLTLTLGHRVTFGRHKCDSLMPCQASRFRQGSIRLWTTYRRLRPLAARLHGKN